MTSTELPEHVIRLRQVLDREPTYLGDDWLRMQEGRKQEEAEFHDRDRQGHADERGQSRQQNRRFYQVADKLDVALEHWMRDHVAGTAFLDFACGHGNQTLKAASFGAGLAVGIDISAVSIQNAIERAGTRGLQERTRFRQRDCEHTQLPADSFDRVLCSGVLHHMDLPSAFAEIYRLCRPGARVLCAEALGHNPFIQRFRDRTPHLRTAWEKDHILRVSDLEIAREWFDVTNLRFYNLAAPAALLMPTNALKRLALPVAELLDTVLTRTPGIRLMSWMFTFELVKPR